MASGTRGLLWAVVLGLLLPLIGAAVAFALALQRSPLMERKPDVSVADVVRAVRVLRSIDPRRQRGDGPREATLVTRDGELLLDQAATLYPGGSLSGGDSPYGVKDMAGNAREWVSDWYDPDYYKHAPDRNPQGPDKKGVVRSIRGGSWHSPLADITTSARGRGGFALQTHGTGFRCARGLEGEAQQK